MAFLAGAGLFAFALLATRAAGQTCESYGVDYQNGGSYFQNISSTADFNFVSIFEGCQNDTANNILVDPNGDEYQCTDTPLQPSDVSEISTCPLQQDDMYSGDWSVLIISNNGDADPIAYERDFYLTVGVPATVTFTPTLTLSSTVTPVYNSTVTTTKTFTTTSVTTTTVPSKTYSPTVTVTPAKVTTTITKTISTFTKTGHAVVPTITTKTYTASCSIPPAQTTPDPTCTITPTLVTAAALSTDASKARFRRMPDAVAVPLDREQRISERKARLAANKKRSPDSATTTVTDTNTADYATTTSTFTAATTTITQTTELDVTSTFTSTTTVQSGATTKSVVTITAATPTVTKTHYVVATVTPYTITRTQTVPITWTYIPPQSTVACSVKGGSWV